MRTVGCIRRYWKAVVCVFILCMSIYLINRNTKSRPTVEFLPAAKSMTTPNTEKNDARTEQESQKALHNVPVEQRPTHVTHCHPKHRFVFIKIHKTGSSTVTTILERYGYRRDLNVAQPPLGTHYFPRNRNFKASLVYLWDLKGADGSRVWPKLGGFHVLVNHARYDRAEQSSLIPNAVYFTIIRKPVSRFESFFSYFLFDREIPSNISEDPVGVFLRSPHRFTSRVNREWLRFFRNGQLYMLGLEPSSYDDPQVVDTKIKSLSNEMDLVMINEYFDESLILLKKLMCWDFQDIVYISKGVRHPTSARNFSTDTQNKIRQWNLADERLYQHFNRTFWEKVRSYGPNFQRDLETFRKLRATLAGKCHANGKREWDWHNSSYWNVSSSASEICQDLLRDDNKWTQMIRKRMKDKTGAFINYTMGLVSDSKA